MKLRFVSLALLAALVGAAIVAPLAATAAPKAAGGTITATGTGTTATNEVTTITGAVSDLVFSVDQATGSLLASGTFTAGGDAVDFVAAIVTPTQSSCKILDLTLGPLDLDLLGLQVHLDQINLQITAQPGPGNLLGNLLCAVAGLLDNPNALAGLLNNLLRHLLG